MTSAKASARSASMSCRRGGGAGGGMGGSGGGAGALSLGAGTAPGRNGTTGSRLGRVVPARAPIPLDSPAMADPLSRWLALYRRHERAADVGFWAIVLLGEIVLNSLVSWIDLRRNDPS